MKALGDENQRLMDIQESQNRKIQDIYENNILISKGDDQGSKHINQNEEDE